MNFPKHSLTLMVKGTFDLKPGGQAVLAKEQPFPTGDEFYPGDEEKIGSPRYASDFACHKPRADMLLVGSCHAPGCRPVSSCPATFRVGDKSKTLAVFGNRHWEKHWLSWKATEPEPFTRMDLRYENCFGGEKFPANPSGQGFAEKSDGAGGKNWPLPNVEDPARLIESSGNRPAPAGFGPLGKMWALRHGKLGTYKGSYLKTRWPWFPEDFDWTHFNAAPTEMQLDGFLRGDERLVCENLHPKHARYESQLPGIRVRCFLNRMGEVKSGERCFDEVELKLDTLWVDMEAEKMVLVWRGWTAVVSEDYEEEIQDIFFISEALSQSPAPVERCHRDFLAFKAATEEKPFESEEPPDDKNEVAVPDPAAAAAVLAAARLKEKAEMRKGLDAQMASLNAQLGLDKMPPELQAQTREKQSKLIERLSENDPAKSEFLAHSAQRDELQAALAKMDLDLDNLPPISAKAHAEQVRLLQELGVSATELKADPGLVEFTTILSAAISKAGMNPENLDTLVAEAQKQKAKFGADEEKVTPSETPKATPPPTRESVQATLAGDGSFEGLDLRGLDLSGLILQRADFAGANLSGVPLRKAKLQQANFSNANLTGADLTEADLTNSSAVAADFSGAKLCQTILKEADLTGAKLEKADLTKAVLDGAILEAALLAGACLSESSAIGTLFPRADLTGVNFQNGVCVKADFSKATLNQADFQKADLTEASLNGSLGHQLNLTAAVLTKLRANGGCDFTGAKVVQAQGNGSMWKAANLTGADFRHAQMEEAMFTGACLKQTNFSAANLKHARFNKANLTGAKLIRANLFQGNLEKANLTQTDLSGANLYEADFLDAVLERTVTDGANLLMTKLEVK